MGRAKKGPKFAVMKKVVTSKAIKSYKEAVLNLNKKDLTKEKLLRNVPNVSSALFFKHNTALGPPYRVLVDTNFINFSIQNKDMWCIGFTKAEGTTKCLTVLRDLVLKDKIVVYDLGRQRIGWAKYNCSMHVNVSVTAPSGRHVSKGSSSEDMLLYKLLNN